MRHPIRFLPALVVLALAMGTSVAHAQIEMVSNIPFAFTAGGKALPAGEYTFRANDEQMTVQITPAHGKSHVALAETRLAAPEPPLAEGRMVFDKVGDQYFLSEFWTPNDEGFLLHATKGKHTHVTVKMAKKA